MILKIWDSGGEIGGWVEFDHVERIGIFYHKALKADEDQGYGGGVYTSLKKPFKVATISRDWTPHIGRDHTEYVEMAFSEGYLLGDDGHTIERL